jgi:hemerythrin-like domain-containing protein
MRATDELKEEHRVIERVLSVIDAAVARQGRGLSPEFFVRVVYFIRNFADICHHGKEEDNLFPAMERRGIPGHDGPVGVMRVEHDRGRAYVREVDEAAKRLTAGDATAMATALRNAAGYAALLRQHIDKEDNILYMMANQVLTESDQRALVAKFEEIELERMGPARRAEFLKLVAQLEAEVGS